MTSEQPDESPQTTWLTACVGRLTAVSLLLVLPGCGEDTLNDSPWTPTGWKQVSAGYTNTCGLRVTGEVDCWGSYSDPDKQPISEGRKKVDPSGEYRRLSEHGASCGIRPSGALRCWGWHGKGGVDVSPEAPPNFLRVSSRLPQTCALRESGSFECWKGTWGSGRMQVWTTLHKTFEGRQIAALSVGQIPCAVSKSGNLRCWKYSPDDGDWPTAHSPLAGDFRDVSVGAHHGCALTRSSTVECWADLPNSHPRGSGLADAPEGKFREIAAGPYHTCGLRADRTLQCCGHGSEPGEEGSRSSGWDYNQAIPPSGTFKQISAGSRHTCGVTTAGDVECWGLGSDSDTDEDSAGKHDSRDYDQAVPPRD
ncbi:MAG: RCC1 domain-containing protein [Bradymonadaceae bacterium]